MSQLLQLCNILFYSHHNKQNDKKFNFYIMKMAIITNKKIGKAKAPESSSNS